MTVSSELAKKSPNVRVIGPFLGLPIPGVVRIVLGLPHFPPETEVNCLIFNDGDQITLSSKTSADSFRVAWFDLKGLKPGAKYRYSFQIQGQALDLEGGLTDTDLWFVAPGNPNPSDSFILMSCHNPFMTKPGSAERGWAMWENLHDKINKDDSIRFLILAGDQLYCDDIEDEYIKKLVAKPDDTDLQLEVKKRFIRQYQLFWEDIHYRRILARIPSYAMWDDHDITDGWGGRLESFDNAGDFLLGWKVYYQIAREAYGAYQGIRNPLPIPGVPRTSVTYFFDYGSARFLMFDFRSEKNSAKRQLLSSVHEEVIYQFIEETPENITTLFAISPVCPLRTNISEDKRVTGILKVWLKWQLGVEGSKKKKNKLLRRLRFGRAWVLVAFLLLAFGSPMELNYTAFWTDFGQIAFLITGVIFWGFHECTQLLATKDELPKLTDDMEDGLSSPINIPVLRRLLKSLFSWQSKAGKKAIILSGDIHAAGVTEIICRNNGLNQTIPQYVSTPVAYTPMPKAVEGFTTTTSEIIVSSDDWEIFARNVFYISKRNYAQIFPFKFKETPENPVHFYLEDHQLPLTMPAQFHR